MKLEIPDEIIDRMKTAAVVALEKAYCPYSKYRVGAAVLTEENEIYAGCNVENASLGLSMCAERNAIFQAVSKGYRKIAAVVIVTSTSDPVPPCGACRQVINEFGNQAVVLSFGKEGNVHCFRLNELLPEAFGPKNLL